jgi:eukaryotic-like serine/threonine-protein kinase
MVGELLSHYRILEQIGEGGMGVVYRALDEQLEREVALKVLPGGALSQEVGRKKFRREALNLAKLNHPNIATVFEFGTHCDVNFLVMELIPGISLHESLKRGPLSEQEILRLGLQFMDGLAVAHDKGIIHRDIKPSNLFLTPDGRLKILDFGLAILFNSANNEGTTQSSIDARAPAGTLPYMSPEQLRGGNIDARSDIFAVGAVLYEMSTGQRSFPEREASRIIDSILNKNPTSPTTLNRSISIGLEQIILKALDKDPDRRYQSARELRFKLNSLLKPNIGDEQVVSEESQSPTLEMAHVLFTDIVEYSRLPMEKQRSVMRQFQRVVRGTPEFVRSDAHGQLIRLPTGDGIALVFFEDLEAPARCAIEISRALLVHPEIKLRIGLHTGPVYRVADINANLNVAGGGINIAQRVMDCGDAGHILLSKAVVDVLSQLSGWADCFMDLGEVQVKHGATVHLFNLRTPDAGNPEIPSKLRTDGIKSRWHMRFLGATGIIAITAALVLSIGAHFGRLRGQGPSYQLPSWLIRGSSTRVLAATRPTIAVLGFKNLSSKAEAAWISPALTEMLGTELAAGEQLRTIPSEQVTRGKIDLALSDENSLGHETLARVRNNLASDFVVLGSFLDLGGQIRVDLSLQDARAGETITNISESGPEQSLPELANRAGARLRHALGVGGPSADDTVTLKLSQSTNLEATKLYSEGILKLHSYDSLSARDLLERAIVADPNYGLAHSALAEAWRSLEYRNKAVAEAKKAMDLSGSYSRESRLAIEAQYRNSTGEFKREAELYKSLFNFFPDNVEYGLSLSKSQYFAGEFQEANSTLDTLQRLPSPQGDDPRIDHVRSIVAIALGDNKKALTLAERVELRAQERGGRRLAAQALQNQCLLLSKLGESAKANTACDKSRTIYSNIGDFGGEAAVWGLLAFQAANRGEALAGRMANERQISLLKKIDSDGGLGYAMTVAGELSADSGDYPRALREYKEALEIYQKDSYQSGIISSHGNLGWVNSLIGNLAEAVKNNEAAIALSHQMNAKGELDLWLGNLADDLLAKGDLPGATKQLSEAFEVNQETGDKRAKTYLHTTRSKLLFAQGMLSESRREADQAIKLCLELNDDVGAEERRLLLARLDIMENHPQTAAKSLRKSLSYFESKKDDANQIAARTALIEALLAIPSDDSKREVARLAKVAPNTQNANLRLDANLQVARAQFALGDNKDAAQLLGEVISQSQRLGYESQMLEAELASAEMELQSDHYSERRAQINRIEKQAEAKGLTLIATKARIASGLIM